MIERYRSYNCSVKYIFISQLIILISLTISLIYCITEHKKDKEMIISNLYSFVFFLIPFIIEIKINYSFRGSKFLKLIPNIICLTLSGIFLFKVFFLGVSFCLFSCSSSHPLNELHLLTFLYMFVFTILYFIIGIKLRIQSFYEDINNNNEQHLNIKEDNKDNNYKIFTSNDMN